MSRRWRLLLVLVAGGQLAHVAVANHQIPALTRVEAEGSTPGTTAPIVPTVAIPTGSSITIPTVTIPTPTARQNARKKRLVQKRRLAKLHGVQIWAFLTSYCPGSAGSMASSGSSVFYGMLANDYYPFGTRVFLPPIRMTGVVEDRTGSFEMWNHFDVWSPVCYSTPTGWFKVVVQTRR